MLEFPVASPVATVPSSPIDRIPVAAADDHQWRADSIIRHHLIQWPLRTSTYPPRSVPTMKKRIVVCCDGTWQDGIIVDARWKYTNILRLSRAVRHIDSRVDPPIPQVVFYQSGVGSANNIYSEFIDGATGASLGEKVEEAYAFIAQNYHPGDEIFLFGFSRGAYTARMIDYLIGEIGVLSRTEMDHFAEIFLALQKLGSDEDLDPDQEEQLRRTIAPWTGPQAPGRKRASPGPDGFSVKCIGVFDTVGSLGLPEELARKSKKVKTFFGFHCSELGAHVERAYQALALNERRADFDCNKFKQSDAGRQKMQVLRQCWFAGCHSDIGGGYPEPDLANLTLAWMAANISDILSLDIKYLASLFEAAEPWGELAPHNPLVGVFKLAQTIQRKLPTESDIVTHEMIHPSVLRQKKLLPELVSILAEDKELLCPLLPLEQELKAHWRVTRPQNTPSIQPLGEAFKQTRSSTQLAGEPDKSDAAHEAAGPLAKAGGWVVVTSIAAFAAGLLF